MQVAVCQRLLPKGSRSRDEHGSIACLSPAAQKCAECNSSNCCRAANECHADISLLGYALFNQGIEALCLQILRFALKQQRVKTFRFIIVGQLVVTEREVVQTLAAAGWVSAVYFCVSSVPYQ
jgi:hypothetical protein